MNIKEEYSEYIYESPDGGITLYRRPYGKNQPREVYDKTKDQWIIS